MTRIFHHKILFFLLLANTFFVSAQTTLTSQVSQSDDDAEELISDGTMDLTSTDLELGSDGGDDQIVGIRFQNINVPQGTTISNAFIQFTVDETNTGSTSVLISGEDVDDAPVFNNTNFNLSSRTTTTATVAWNNIVSWNTVGQANADQRTPNLTAIVQEIVDRAGWTSGNDMVFFVDGSGERTAESFNGDSSRAPVLTIIADLSPSDGDDDDDGDGVINAFDLCEGSDDSVDTDGDGVPDGCDSQNGCASGFASVSETESGIYYAEEAITCIRDDKVSDECDKKALGAPDGDETGDFKKSDDVAAFRMSGRSDAGSQITIFFDTFETNLSINIALSQDGVSYGSVTDITSSDLNGSGNFIFTAPAQFEYIRLYHDGIDDRKFKLDAIQSDYTNTIVTCQEDTDNDGLVNSDDLDDDNDGILDTEECTVDITFTPLSVTGFYSYAQDIDGDEGNHFGEQNTGQQNDPMLIFDGDVNTEMRLHEDDIFELAFGQVLPAGTQLRLIEGSGAEDGLISVYVSNGSMDPAGDANSSTGGGVGYSNTTSGRAELIFANITSDQDYTFTAPIDVTHVQFVSHESHGGWGELIIDPGTQRLFSPTATYCDTDGDGIPNSSDLDSDGDGCSDANEAYNDTNADGGDNSFYGTGSPPAINANGTVAAASYATPVDTDSDGVPNYLQIGGSVSITAQPQNQNIDSGDTANFSVSVTGSNLVYQWFVSTNGGGSYSALTGETSNTLTLTNVPNTEDGNKYRVEVRDQNNLCDDTTSLSAILTVNDMPPTVDAEGDQNYCPGFSVPVAESISITDPDDTTTNSIFIQISSGYVPGEDLLTLTGSHPNITATWNATQGELSLTGPATYSEFEAAILAVEYASSAAAPTGWRQFSITVGVANYLPATGHYYRYIDDLGITWTDARAAADASTYFGLQGYLATLTSQEEADFSGTQAAGTGWIGGSDAATEGVWEWVTGPEAGLNFWNGAVAGSSPNFAFWNNNEPNQSGNEDYAHITHPNVNGNGSWNDLSNTGANSGNYQPQGYVVEYGGMPGDPTLNIADVTSITMVEQASINTQPVDQTVEDGTNATFSVSATGTDISYQWQQSTDGGSTFTDISGATNSDYTLTADIWDDGNQYQVNVVDGSNSCSTAVSSAATLTVSYDTDNDGVLDVTDLDDDNDGILDTVENPPLSILWVTNDGIASEEQYTIDKLSALGHNVTVVDDNVGGDAANFDVTFVYEDAVSGVAFANVVNLATTSQGVITSETFLHDELLGANQGSTSATNIVNIVINDHPITRDLTLGNNDIGDGSFRANSLASGTVLGLHPSGEASIAVWETGDALDVGTAPGRRAIVPHSNSNGGFNNRGANLLVNAILWSAGGDTDRDGIYDYLDTDSDNDGIYDALEAGHDQTFTNGRVDGVVGADGVPNAVQASGQEDSGNVNYTIEDSNSDSSFDAYESDSDDDGCSDANEAYGRPDADSDDNGYYGSGIPTVDANGAVTMASYQTPEDGDGNGIYDFKEAGTAPSIDNQPDDTTACPGCNATFSVAVSDADSFQWQRFDGTIWTDLTDTGGHSGTSTNTLTITNASSSENGNQYRVVVSNSALTCASETSNPATLTVNVKTVITNRRITYRVKKN